MSVQLPGAPVSFLTVCVYNLDIFHPHLSLLPSLHFMPQPNTATCYPLKGTCCLPQYFVNCLFIYLSFFYSNHLFIYLYLFLSVLGRRFCARAFSSCGERGPLFIAVRGPLTIAASPVAEHRLQMRRLSNCGSRAQSLRGMWDLPRPGLEPVSPALAGGFSTTAPPGKPYIYRFIWLNFLKVMIMY